MVLRGRGIEDDAKRGGKESKDVAFEDDYATSCPWLSDASSSFIISS